MAIGYLAKVSEPKIKAALQGGLGDTTEVEQARVMNSREDLEPRLAVVSQVKPDVRPQNDNDGEMGAVAAASPFKNPPAVKQQVVYKSPTPEMIRVPKPPSMDA